MRRKLTSPVAALTLVLFAGLAFGADLTASPVTFTSEGASVQAVLYQAAGGAKQPALVLSPGRTRNIKGIEWLSRALADRGYVVLAQQYRDGDVRYFWRDAEDIRNAISHLEKLSSVDGARIGIVGHSRGGMASLLAAASDMRVRSTVALSAPTDHLRYVRGLREYAPSRYAEMVKAHGGSPEDIAEYYREVSGVTHAERIKTPVLLVHGTLDLVAPHDHSQWIRVRGLYVLGDPVLFGLRSQIADLALKHRLPSISPYREGADAGGLIAYGVSLAGTWRHAAQYVDKILKGAKPSELPVEQPNTSELVVNLRTATALRLAIPHLLVSRADELLQ